MKKLITCTFLFLLFVPLIQAINDPFYPFHPTMSIPFSDSNLPVVMIELNEKMADKIADTRIQATMKIVWHKDGTRNKKIDTDAFDYNGKIGIKYRGNSSYNNSDKKPFAIQTWNNSGKKEKVSILGMEKDDDWALLAPFNDKSLIRDMLLYQLMQGTMEYVPTGRYCELILNGVYQGVYIMAARVRQGKGRINIEKPTADAGDGLTGGYHLEIDRSDSPGFFGDMNPMSLYEANKGEKTYYQYKFPDLVDLTTKQVEYIQRKVKSMEYAFYKNEFKDKNEGFRAFIDTFSMMDFYIAQEFTKNVDGYRLSTPLYKDVDSKGGLFKFSIWDFNISMGNADYFDGWSPEGWAFNNNRFYDNNLIPYLFKRGIQDPIFYNGIKNRWREYRKSRLSDQTIIQVTDSLTRLLDESQNRNFMAWPRFSQYVWPNYYISSSWFDEVSYLKRWLLNRTKWIDSQWNPAKNINFVANPGFEASEGRGYTSEVRLSEWNTWGSVAELSSSSPFEGNFSISLGNSGGIYQVVTELKPGKYTLNAQVNSQGSPDGYMYIKHHSNFYGGDDLKLMVQNNKAFHLIEIKDIQVKNGFVEIGFGAVYKNSNTRMRIDNVAFFRQDDFSSVDKLDKKELILIAVNRDAKEVKLSNIPYFQQNVEVFNAIGNRIYSTTLQGIPELTIGKVFKENNIYIIRIGNTTKKIKM